MASLLAQVTQRQTQLVQHGALSRDGKAPCLVDAQYEDIDRCLATETRNEFALCWPWAQLVALLHCNPNPNSNSASSNTAAVDRAVHFLDSVGQAYRTGQFALSLATPVCVVTNTSVLSTRPLLLIQKPRVLRRIVSLLRILVTSKRVCNHSALIAIQNLLAACKKHCSSQVNTGLHAIFTETIEIVRSSTPNKHELAHASSTDMLDAHPPYQMQSVVIQPAVRKRKRCNDTLALRGMLSSRDGWSVAATQLNDRSIVALQDTQQSRFAQNNTSVPDGTGLKRRKLQRSSQEATGDTDVHPPLPASQSLITTQLSQVDADLVSAVQDALLQLIQSDPAVASIPGRLLSERPQVLVEYLQSATSGDIGAPFAAFVSTVLRVDQSSGSTFEHACDAIASVANESKCSDELIMVICALMLQSEVSFHRAVHFLQTVITPRVILLRAPATRVFATTLTNAATSLPSATIQGLLAPCISDTSMGSAQCEIVTRVIKKCLTETHKSVLLQQVLAYENAEWSDYTTRAIVAIIERPITMSQGTATLLTQRLVDHSTKLSKSLHFARLMFSFVSKYPGIAVHHTRLLEHAASKLKTFMQKSVSKALAKLSAT
jgi:Fanconi Anaemia group E protein FANCE